MGLNHLPIQFCKPNKQVLQVATGALLALYFPHVSAEEITKNATINSSLVYDSNPNLSEDNINSVYRLTLTPQFNVNIKDELDSWSLGAGLLVERYSNQQDFVNREDPRLVGEWNHTYERGTFGLKAEYAEKSARLDELKNTGEIQSVDNTQKDKALSATWQHDLTKRSHLLLEGVYSDISYSSPGSLEAYKLMDLKSQFLFEKTARLNTLAYANFSHLRPDRVLSSTSLMSIGIGINYQLSESVTLASRAGVFNLSGRQSETGWLADGLIEKKTAQVTYGLRLTRALVATGLGGFRDTDTAKLAWQYDLSAKDAIGLEYQVEKNKEDLSVGVDKLKLQQFTAFYDRDISDHWKAKVSIVHKDVENAGKSAQANIIDVSLAYDTLNF